MVKCPVSFDHPSEAIRLEYIGEKLCSRLYDELKRHCEREGLPQPEYRPSRKLDLCYDAKNLIDD